MSIVRHIRSFRGGRSRSTRPVMKTYKKVLNFQDIATFSSGFFQELIIAGTDSVAIGQTSNVDAVVPTGAVVKFIECQIAVSNVATSVPIWINCSLQYLLGGQTVVDPDAVGGNPRRNQVLHQEMYSVGENQNSNHKFKFKIPKGFQRVREGMQWLIVWSTNGTVRRQMQIIYKVHQ